MENKLHNDNIKETKDSGLSSGTVENVPTIDMSGTNAPEAKESVPKNDAKDALIKNAEKNEVRKTVKEVKVRLLSPHTHEGIDYEAGDIIDMDTDSADYIERVEVGVRV